MTPTRKSLAAVLAGTSRDDLARLFNEAEAAGDLRPLPAGTYRCLVSDGTLDTAKSGTPGYSLTFTVREGEHKGRKFWLTCWLTPAAMPMSKRDLGKLGITNLDMLETRLPQGIVADVRVVEHVDDDGTARNRVKGFEVVEIIADPTRDEAFGGDS